MGFLSRSNSFKCYLLTRFAVMPLLLFAYSNATLAQMAESQTATQFSRIKTTSPFQGTWKLELSAQDSRDEMTQSSGVSYRGDLNLVYRLSPWISLNAAPVILGQSGHVQSDTENGSMASGSASLLVRNATADLLFLQNSRLQFGIANQKQVHTPMLIDDRGFPAVRAHLKSAEKSYLIWGVFAQAAVPTSASLTTNSREFERTPSFNSAGISAGINSIGSLIWKNQASLFEYKNLPQNIATTSGLIGNTVQVTNSTDAQFVYAYRGVELNTDLTAPLTSRLSVHAMATAMQNTAAPKGFNTGTSAQLEMPYLLNSSLEIAPSIQGFRIEPDTAVAAYNSNRFHTNTIGYRGGIKATMNHSFSIIGSGGERGPLFENPAQSRERFVELTLETLDAKF